MHSFNSSENVFLYSILPDIISILLLIENRDSTIDYPQIGTWVICDSQLKISDNTEICEMVHLNLLTENNLLTSNATAHGDKTSHHE